MDVRTEQILLIVEPLEDVWLFARRLLAALTCGSTRPSVAASSLSPTPANEADPFLSWQTLQPHGCQDRTDSYNCDASRLFDFGYGGLLRTRNCDAMRPSASTSPTFSSQTTNEVTVNPFCRGRLDSHIHPRTEPLFLIVGPLEAVWYCVLRLYVRRNSALRSTSLTFESTTAN
jgi:hypothetical protein